MGLSTKAEFNKKTYQNKNLNNLPRQSSNVEMFGVLSKFKGWYDLTDEQQRFCYSVLNKRNILLTGAAGTGKSTVLNFIFNVLSSKNYSYGKTATTGIAALNIGGSTLHSFCGIGLGDKSAIELLRQVHKNKKILARLRAIDYLFIDEISMLSGELFDKIEFILSSVKNSSEPFGGICIIASGDFLQLPPIIRNPSLKDDFIFESKSFYKANFNVIHFNTIVRQKEDKEFATILNQLRKGNLSNIDRIKERIGATLNTPENIRPVKIFGYNNSVNEYNEQQLSLINEEIRVYKSIDYGQDYHVEFFNKNCPAVQTLNLKKGCQVMLLWNLKVSDGLVNGAIGTVVGYEPNKLPIVKFSNGHTTTIEKETWEIKEQYSLNGKIKYKTIASRTQLPLKLAYAASVHKCLDENSIIHLSDKSQKLNKINKLDITYGINNKHNVIINEYDVKSDCLKVIFESGKEIICSASHKFGVATTFFNSSFVEAISLKEGDPIISKINFPTPKEQKLSLDLCWWLGATIGDGSYNSGKTVKPGNYRIDFTNIPTECGEIWKKIAEKIFKIKISSQSKKNNKSRNYYFYSKKVREYLESIGLKYVKLENKSVPDIIFECSRDEIISFICGLIDTDGHINKNTIVLSSCNKKLLIEIKILLEIVGYKSTIYTEGERKFKLVFKNFDARRFYLNNASFLKAKKKYKNVNHMLKYSFKFNKIQNNDIIFGINEWNKIEKELSRFYGKKYGNDFRLHMPKKCGNTIISAIRSHAINNTLSIFHIEYLYKYIPNFKDLGPFCNKVFNFIKEGLYIDRVKSVILADSVNLKEISLDKTHIYFSGGVLHHNCQGQTFEFAEINLNEIFCDSQAYVALSRVKSLNGLSLSGDFDESLIKPNKKCLDFYLNYSKME